MWGAKRQNSHVLSNRWVGRVGVEPRREGAGGGKCFREAVVQREMEGRGSAQNPGKTWVFEGSQKNFQEKRSNHLQ